MYLAIRKITPTTTTRSRVRHKRIESIDLSLLLHPFTAYGGVEGEAGRDIMAGEAFAAGSESYEADGETGGSEYGHERIRGLN
jgi:hypothetical protein